MGSKEVNVRPSFIEHPKAMRPGDNSSGMSGGAGWCPPKACIWKVELSDLPSELVGKSTLRGDVRKSSRATSVAGVIVERAVEGDGE